MFVRGPVVCSKIVGDFQTGAKWPCKCEGFRPITGELSEASFAAPENEDDLTFPPLRTVGEAGNGY